MSEPAKTAIPVVRVTELWSVVEKGGTGRLGVHTAELGPMLVSIDPNIILALRGELNIVESLLNARRHGAPPST